MSKELLQLLQRIEREPLIQPPTDEPPKLTVGLQTLFGQMATRQWKQSTETELRGFIEQTKREMYFVEHVPNCEQCLLEVQLGIERYNGTRLPWFLNISTEIGFGPDVEFDDEFEPHLKGMPRVWDYKIGSYWSGSSDDTIRFIKDRLAWAEKKLTNDLDCAVTALVTLERFKLTFHTPQEDIDAVILRVNRLESQISPLFYFLGCYP